MNPEPTKLFVYGIFLSEGNRRDYGMTNPSYATVPDYTTVGGHIVQATRIPAAGLSLTGLLVDYDPTQWERLDALEAGYDRIIVTTHGGVEAYMYAQREHNVTNHSTWQSRITEVNASER